MSSPGNSAGKEIAYTAGVPSSIPGSGSSPGEGIGYPLQYSWASLVAQCGGPGFKTWVWLIPWRMAWQPAPVYLHGESPGTEEPGGLQPMGSQKVRHNWATKQHSTQVLFCRYCSKNPFSCLLFKFFFHFFVLSGRVPLFCLPDHWFILLPHTVCCWTHPVFFFSFSFFQFSYNFCLVLSDMFSLLKISLSSCILLSLMSILMTKLYVR